MRIAIILLLTLLFMSHAQAGKLYRWVDEQGRTHYSQTPPPSVLENAESRDLPDSDRPANTTEAPPPTDADAAEPATVEDEDNPPSELEKLQAKKQERCDKFKAEFDKLQSGDPLVMTDPDNPDNIIAVSDEVRQQHLEKNRAYLQTYCDFPPAAEGEQE